MCVQMCAYEHIWRYPFKTRQQICERKNILLSSVKIEGGKQYHMHPNRTAGCFNLSEFQPSSLKTEVNYVRN